MTEEEFAAVRASRRAGDGEYTSAQRGEFVTRSIAVDGRTLTLEADRDGGTGPKCPGDTGRHSTGAC